MSSKCDNVDSDTVAFKLESVSAKIVKKIY